MQVQNFGNGRHLSYMSNILSRFHFCNILPGVLWKRLIDDENIYEIARQKCTKRVEKLHENARMEVKVKVE